VFFGSSRRYDQHGLESLRPHQGLAGGPGRTERVGVELVGGRSDRAERGDRPEQRRGLIATGIYNEDGTVNMETARRLGWDRIWEERSRPSPAPAH
jgi:hypothetical protein